MGRQTTEHRHFGAALVLDRSSGLGLRDALYAALVKLIMSGALAPGDVLPSTRILADQLRVSRNTVSAAYRKLLTDELIVSHDRATFRINSSMRRQIPQPPEPSFHDGEGARAPLVLPGSMADLPRIEKDNLWRSCRYPFIYGQCDPSTFPIANWRTTMRELNSVDGITVWTREAYDEDHPELVDALVRSILPRHGLWVKPEEVLVTAGAQNALYMISRLLLPPGGCAVVEDPGYTDISSIMSACGADVVPVPVDADGLQVDLVPPHAVLVYCTPERHFPTTVRLSHARRTELLRIAGKGGCHVIEDGYDSELPFQGVLQPCLRALAPRSRIIHVGSFSKTLAPGLRVGYVVAEEEVIRQLRLIRRLVLRNPSTLNQAAIGRFVNNGYYDAHLQRLRAVYQQRSDILQETLANVIPHATFPSIEGGTSLWVRLPTGMDTRTLYTRLLDKSVFVEEGGRFFHQQPDESFLRLGFASIPTDLIPSGVDILAQEVRRQLKENAKLTGSNSYWP